MGQEEDVAVTQVLRELSDWAKAKSPASFGHLQADRAWSMSVVERAIKLVEAYAGEKIMYAVSGRMQEDVILSTKLVAAGLNNVEVLSHANLYTRVKAQEYPDCLRDGTIVICEVDNQYSLQFAYSMACLMYGAEKFGSGRVLIVSHDSVEEPLNELLRLVAPSLRKFQHFRLHASQQDLSVSYWDGEGIDDTVLQHVDEALEMNQSILVFASTSSAGKVCDHIEKDGTEPLPPLLHAQSEADEITRGCEGRLSRAVVIIDSFPRRTVNIPLAIHRLGLIIIDRQRVDVKFDDRSSHLVSDYRDLSQAEFDDAKSHAYLSDLPLEKVAIWTNASPNASRHPGPPRRIENDQLMAFLFESLQVCPSVRSHELMVCFMTRFDRVPDCLRRLLHGGWAYIDYAAQDIRRIKTSPTERTKALIQLLPEFGYEFTPASFLAGFGTGDSIGAKRAAIRMAAIQYHSGTPLFSDFRFDEIPGMTEDQIIEYLPKIFRITCQVPPYVFMQGMLWIELAVWHTASLFPNPPDWFSFIIGGVMKGYFLTQKVKVERIACLVRHLETTFGLSTTPSPLVLEDSDCDRVQDELLKAWMHQSVALRITEVEDDLEFTFFDMVDERVGKLQQDSRDIFLPDQILPCPEHPAGPIWLLSLEFHRRKDALFGNRLVVIPLAALQRWQRNHSERLELIVRTVHGIQ
ncbi:hypothetical protein G7046_g1008 [Stylonectria norvegica]|nr:hypothetical protein G7046_g1008 [Stylonectria norvegica]